MCQWFERFKQSPGVRQAIAAKSDNATGRFVTVDDLLPVAREFLREHPECPHSDVTLSRSV